MPQSPAGETDPLAPEPSVRTGALIGYARVSTKGADPGLADARSHPGRRIRVFVGKNVEREELAKVLDYLRARNTLAVPSLDRLGRSIQDLITIVADLRRRGIGFTPLHEALDTTTPGGRLIFHASPPWLNRPGIDGDSEPTKGWSHASTEEVSG